MGNSISALVTGTYSYSKIMNHHNLKSTPPHDIVNESVSNNLIKPGDYEKAVILNKIMTDSQKVLKDHPINHKRITNGKKPANMIWLWGQGGKPQMTPFKDKYGLKGPPSPEWIYKRNRRLFRIH